MDIRFDIEGLKALCRSFHSITGVKIGIFLPDGTPLAAYGGSECEFCRLIKSDQQFLNKCIAQDRKAMECAIRGQTKVYRCHAGLYESVAPIIFDGTPVACLMIGQIAPEGIHERELTARLKGHPQLAQIIDAFAQMPPRSDEYLTSCVRIITACAGYIFLNNLVSLEHTSLSQRFQDYIATHYAETIVLKDMAAALGVCVTKLCTTIQTEYGASPHAFLSAYRIDRAKELLANTVLPISEIAVQVGINDYNYFSRVFKAKTGLTPSQFRKSVSNA